MARPENENDRTDSRNLDATRGALRRADTTQPPAGQSPAGQSPTGQGGATGSGAAGPVERGPAETVRDVVQGDQGAAPQTPGAAGVSSGLPPGGGKA